MPSMDDVVKDVPHLIASKIDLAKHIMTLASATLVLTATFYEKLSSAPHGRRAALTGICFLLSTIITGILSCSSLLRAHFKLMEIALTFRASLEHTKSELVATLTDMHRATKVSDRLYIASLSSFVIAMTAVGIFAFVNFR